MYLRSVILAVLWQVVIHAQGRQFPDAPGKAVAERLCSACHPGSMALDRGRTRDQWGQVLTTMVTRGMKASEDEMAQVLDYFAKNLAPDSAVFQGRPAAPARRPGGGLTVGANDRHVVDAEAAARGRTTYIAECITCHGPRGRGNEDGPNRGADLVRSLVVLHDRYGDHVGPFLKKAHPTQSGKATASFTVNEAGDLAQFLHEKVEDTLRSGPYNSVLNVLTGDAKAGQAYFNGAGKCNSCHSPEGDLAGIAKRFDPPSLQQRFLFPGTASFGRRGGGGTRSKPVMVTVTAPGVAPITGTLDRIDDFNVSLRDASGEYRSWKRTANLKVEKNDPYAAHVELLEHYTDKNMHDVLAFLVTLK